MQCDNVMLESLHKSSDDSRRTVVLCTTSRFALYTAFSKFILLITTLNVDYSTFVYYAFIFSSSEFYVMTLWTSLKKLW